MTDAAARTGAGRPGREFRSEVRGRTLVLIRWIAVAGQLVTLLIVRFVLNFALPIGPAIAAVAASAAFNLWAQRRTRAFLSEREAAVSLGFDVIQLSVLLSLVGGLENPFALLILAPVTIAASILSLRSTVALAAVSALGVTAIALWHLPLPWERGAFSLPPLYVAGLWIALVLSIALLAAYNWSIAEEARRRADALAATQAALAREQRLSAMGMLAASAAHQLGSPLGTIAVTAKEIARDLPAGSPLAEDAALLLSEVTRCREILAGLGTSPEEAGASPFARLPLDALVAAAAAAHPSDRIRVRFESHPEPGAEDSPMPALAYSAEIIHGLGSLIQNAIQFARREVQVTTLWSPVEVRIEIRDDGPGFAPHILPLLGEPYLSTRKGEGEHMGLGVFIAQTLLERTGAVVSFANRRDKAGALVSVRWPRGRMEEGRPAPGGSG